MGKCRAQILEEFAEMGDRFAFTVNRNHYEGYIAQINARSLEFTPAGPMADGNQISIDLKLIDLDTLAFCDSKEKVYKKQFGGRTCNVGP